MEKKIRIQGGQEFTPQEITVPGDISRRHSGWLLGWFQDQRLH